MGREENAKKSPVRRRECFTIRDGEREESIIFASSISGFSGIGEGGH